jgi:hypothetical protein
MSGRLYLAADALDHISDLRCIQALDVIAPLKTPLLYAGPFGLACETAEVQRGAALARHSFVTVRSATDCIAALKEGGDRGIAILSR